MELKHLRHRHITDTMDKFINFVTLQKDIIARMPNAKCSAKDAKIMGGAIMEIIAFQHFMVKIVKLNQSILSNILYLLKKAYDLRKHDNGQLLLLRAIGIAQEVSTFTPDHKIIYASLLYDLPCYSWVPISWANYDMVIASYVKELASIKSFS